MKKILGLDLGTNSIGWALVNEADKENEKNSIIKAGVRVNPLTVDEQNNFEKGKSITTNADRTLKRGARRNLHRYKLRRNYLINELLINDIINDDSKFSEDGSFSTFHTLKIRAKATNEKLELEDFAKVLLSINKKRGYKSSRKADKQEDGVAIDAMGVAKLLNEKGITPGQYVLDILKSGKKIIPDFYRSDLQEEYNRIWNFQKQFFSDILTNELKEELDGKTSKVLDAVFYKQKLTKAETPKGNAQERKLQEYQWRVDAITKQIDIREVIYVLGKISAEINNSSGYLGAISDRSKELFFNNQTVGQYLYNQIKANSHTSLKNQVFYRQDYLDEFERIWETQSKFHPQLTTDLKRKIKDVVIFYQRPLKSQKGLLSFCEFESKTIEVNIGGKIKNQTIGQRVIPRSSPLFQEFKIWQVINNLILTDINGGKQSLDFEDKQILFEELNLKGKMTSTEALKLLYKNAKEFRLNYENIEGNTTNAALLEAYAKIFEVTGHDKPDFKKMTAKEILQTLSDFFEANGYNQEILRFDTNIEGKAFEKQPFYQLWHLLYSYEGETPDLAKIISTKYGFEIDLAKIIAAIKLQEDYGSLSSKAIRKILPFMKEGNMYDVACVHAGYNHSNSKDKDERASRELIDKLDILPKNSLRNPVVEKILNQMINVINAVIDEYGKPDEVRIEMARELKQTAAEREKTTQAISKATRDYDNFRQVLKNEFGLPYVSRNDLIRYKLYLELEPNGYKTLYSNTYIPKEKLFSKEFDIEHIIPQSRLFDDSFSNKTLEVRSVNIEKGNETAYDYVSTKGETVLQQYIARVNSMKDMSSAKRKKLLMEGDKIPDGFIERDLRDTQYIAKKAKELLENVVRTVNTTTGSVTDRLREDWQIINVLQELNWDKYNRLGLTEIIENKDGQKIKKIKDWTKRNDHRHHAMDAITVAFTRYNHIQYLNYMNARRNEKHKQSSIIYAIEQKELYRDEHKKLLFKPPMPIPELRTEVKKHLDNILVSYKAKNKVVTKNINKIKSGKGYKKVTELTPRGQLHLETVYGSSQQYVTKEEKVNATFDEQKINSVAKKVYRDALMKRLIENGNDPSKAFTGKNSLSKTPIYLDEHQKYVVPEKVKLVKMHNIYTIRKDISPDLKVEKVVDVKVKKILEDRLKSFGNDAKKAFSNLEDNPIWLNEEKGISIKRVTITGVSNAVALHNKKDKEGKEILDANGNKIPVDFVNTGNNHHVAIYKDEKGNLQEEVVTFYEAVARRNMGDPVIKRVHENGWELLFTMKQNEYFVFPNEETGFNPQEVDLLDESKYALISPNLFRVQKMGNISTSGIWFRHHLETNVELKKELKSIAYKVVQSTKYLENIIKVRVNHLGKIVQIGEY